MKTIYKTKQDIYDIMGNSRSKYRAFFGIAIDILDIDADSITVRVEQKELKNGWVLSQKELVSRAGQLFDEIDGYKLRFVPLTHQPDYSNIDYQWVKEKMAEFDLKNKDIVKHSGIDKHEISRLLNNVRPLTKAQKAFFYFYFLNFEVNRDLREYLDS